MFCILAASGGFIFTATMMGLIQKKISLSEEEERIYIFIGHKENLKQFRNQASKMISSCFKLSLIRKIQKYD